MILLNPELQSKYEQDRNSLRLFAQENPRDRLNIEIGDSKDGAIFQPQFKLLRFDNEYNLSVRLLHNEKEIPKIQTDGNRLIWQAGQTKIRFYEKEKSKELPDGGYEMDQIVNLKKSGNVFYYTLQIKGIEIWPQEKLTEQQKAKGEVRPDYIEGGCAFYASDKRINIENGKLYRSGKIGEMHAPIITDSAGRFAKCGLLIIAERGLMRITVPDDFAAKVQNPCILDPTFGYTTAGGSYESTYSNSNILTGHEAKTPAYESEVESITFKGRISAQNTKGIITDGNTIVTNGITPAANINVYDNWATISYTTKPKLSRDKWYRLALISAGSIDNMFYDTEYSGNYNKYYHNNNYSSPTNPTWAAEDYNKRYSIYATIAEIKSSAFFVFI